ncbi:MAG TPA: lamin tail domain-containing protein [bacterium]|nr:lamin tail domain-containing protein [bacterium]
MPARAGLILNEALANEPGSATTLEWIELLHWPDTGADVSLQGYRLLDGGSIITFDTSLVIPAGGFAVLARKTIGAASFEARWGDSSGVWGDRPDESFPLIAVGQMSLRNAGDTVRLVSPTGDTSLILWASDAGDGRSIERIRPGDNDAPSNFAPSVAPSGSTPGSPNSVLPPRGDLAIDTLVTGPLLPTPDDTVRVAVRIRNVGFGDVAGGTLTLRHDGSAARVIVARPYPAIPESGELTLVLDWPNPPPGISPVTAWLNEDADSSNNARTVPVLVRFNRPHLVISEYLANPETPGPDEWVEIANVSDWEIRLEGLRVGDSLNSESIPATAGAIPAGGFHVLAENAAAFRAHYPDFTGALTGIPGWRALNNTGDGIRLIGPSGEIIDSLSFRLTYPDNRSVERVELTPSYSVPGDWTVSEAPLGATPGTPNSVARGETGSLMFDSVWIEPALRRWGDTLTLAAAVRNHRFGPASGFILTVLRELDFANPGAQREPIAELAITAMDEGQSAILALPWVDAPIGLQRLQFSLRDAQGTAADSAAIVITILCPPSLLIISEYMAAPVAGFSGEWIELYNTATVPVDLRGVQIGDSTALSSLPPTASILEPGAFVVLAQDEDQFRSAYQEFAGEVLTVPAWRTLGDGGDRIRLAGAGTEIIDSLTYAALPQDWRSLERRQLLPRPADRRDWGHSIDPWGATPGRPNSIARNDNDLALTGFGLDASGVYWPSAITGSLEVVNEGFATVEQAKISIVDGISDTEVWSTVLPSLAPESAVVVPFEFGPLPPGFYILRAAVPDDEFGDNNSATRSMQIGHTFPGLVIAEYLADPASPGPGEWVELYNASDMMLTLRGCGLGDSVGYAPLPISAPFVLAPGDYVVLCQDRVAFLAWYAGFTGDLIEVRNWRELNNDGDRIRLRGVLGEIIDSLTYVEGAGHNRSWERISLSPTYSTRADWTASVAAAGATPGAPNSVDAAAAGPLDVAVSPNPVFRAAGQIANIVYRIDIGERLTLKIFDRDGHTVRTIVDDAPSASGSIAWNGTDDDGADLRPGPYILLARSEPAGSTKKLVVVLAP